MIDFANAKVIGFFSIPSPALAEQNPDAYNNAMAGAPAGAGTCAHCGTGIRNHVIVKLTDGRDVFLGTSCAEKVGGEVEQCMRSGGITSEVLYMRRAKQAAESARFAAQRQVLAKQAEANKWLIDLLAGCFQSSFVVSIGQELKDGWNPVEFSDRKKHAICDCIAKSIGGRSNSKAYRAAYDTVADRLHPAL